MECPACPSVSLTGREAPLEPCRCTLSNCVSKMSVRCGCPCGRQTPLMQDIREMEEASGGNLVFVRCACGACGRQTGGRNGCHYRIPLGVARRYGAYCWVCLALRHFETPPPASSQSGTKRKRHSDVASRGDGKRPEPRVQTMDSRAS